VSSINNKKLFVGNLSWSVTSDSLRQLFEKAGKVMDAVVLIDKMTGRSKGFGFVEMATDEEASKAIEMFADKDFEGRKLTVNVARPKPER
jgi:RNA recognition motif-containing protein